MVSLALRDIRLKEQQGRVGGSGGRNGDWLHGIVLGEFQSKVVGERCGGAGAENPFTEVTAGTAAEGGRSRSSFLNPPMAITFKEALPSYGKDLPSNSSSRRGSSA
jgi:hypothetical protein